MTAYLRLNYKLLLRLKWNIYIKYIFTSPVIKCFIFWREKQSAISETNGNDTPMRVTHRFEILKCLSPRMHQTLKNRYNPNGYGSIRVTSISCGHEAQKRHGKNTAFLSICILLIRPSIVINNKDLLTTRLIFNFYAQLSCKHDWNIFLLLNTNGPLTYFCVY